MQHSERLINKVSSKLKYLVKCLTKEYDSKTQAGPCLPPPTTECYLGDRTQPELHCELLLSTVVVVEELNLIPLFIIVFQFAISFH